MPEREPEPMAGPATPEEDETFGPEPDDPRAAAPYDEPYEVVDFDPAHEERDMCEEDERGVA